MGSGVLLANLSQEENLKANCIKLGIIGYIAPDPYETEDKRDARHRQLQWLSKTNVDYGMKHNRVLIRRDD